MLYGMTIHIDVITEEAEVIVYLAGRLSGETTKELRDICEAINETFVLDLSKLLFTDDAGIDAMRVISEQGTQIRGASQFIQLLASGTLNQKVDDE
jgi:anti-anti-sigma regulatory factor